MVWIRCDDLGLVCFLQGWSFSREGREESGRRPEREMFEVDGRRKSRCGSSGEEEEWWSGGMARQRDGRFVNWKLGGREENEAMPGEE